MLNWFFLILIAGAVLVGAFLGTLPAVSNASMDSAKSAVTLALSLVGQMGLWLGFMRVLQEAGLMRALARALAPIMKRLFPDVPEDHPAMGAMILNISANMLGLGNAATPFGLKAMVELNRLNRHPGTATNAMVLFLAINTSGVAVLPLGAVAMRAALGSNDAAGIIVPSILATMCSTLMGVIAVKILERLKAFAPPDLSDTPNEGTPQTGEGSAEQGDKAETKERKETKEASEIKKEEQIAGLSQANAIADTGAGVTTGKVRAAIVLIVWLACLFAVGRAIHAAEAPILEVVRTMLSGWLLPMLMLAIVSAGFARRVKVYEAFISGAKEAFQIAIQIIPFLIAILVSIGMFRASGAMDAVTNILGPVTRLVGMPPEVLPMALIRPLSGSGALAILTETMKTFGPDSLVGYTVSVMSGSTETTFYVLAVYFGAVGVKATRHTVPACLAADITGILAACWISRLFFG